MATDNIYERDYRLDGPENIKAYENGLVEASWYLSPVPRNEMRKLLKRKDGPAIRDTLIWFGLLFGSGYAMALFWGTWWMVLPLIIYSTIYGSTSDSRWHEAGHGTAFKSTWMNNILYEIASFMVFRESTPWRWSHTRHHSDTIIRGRDPEIAVKRPPIIPDIMANFINLKSAPAEFKKMLMHCAGKLDSQEVSYLPATEYNKTFLKARIYITIYAAMVGLSVYYWTLLPLFLIGIPSFIGSWLKVIYGLSQHAGLAENVLDHRLNSRTIHMNRIHRYLYWNMNYHIEHHMYPMVPYHALPKLHALVKDDMPIPYNGIIHTYKEIIPALLRQAKYPGYYVKRELPVKKDKENDHTNHIYRNSMDNRNDKGLIEICPAADIDKDDIIRFDLDTKTFAVYRTHNDEYYITDGICTHGNTHLCEGLMLGHQVECAKHNGRFDIKDGSPQRPPVSRGLNTYELINEDGMLLLNITGEVLEKIEEQTKTTTFKVVDNNNVATFIKELVLAPLEHKDFNYQPGDYIKLEIPPYSVSFDTLHINEPYAGIWNTQNLMQLKVKNEQVEYRNYSMATNPDKDHQLRFNVRIALPPKGIDCYAGIGSSYVFSLKPGDIVRVIGPFGDFHMKDTGKEMVYIGGGSGMAPLRAHISYLFDTLNTNRRVSYWYGARSKQELFYVDYFEELARKHENFTFHVALSETKAEDNWNSYTGLIHDVVRKEFLSKSDDSAEKEYYLCGPPVLIKAATGMLSEMGVPSGQIAYDEFS